MDVCMSEIITGGNNFIHWSKCRVWNISNYNSSHWFPVHSIKHRRNFYIDVAVYIHYANPLVYISKKQGGKVLEGEVMFFNLRKICLNFIIFLHIHCHMDWFIWIPKPFVEFSTYDATLIFMQNEGSFLKKLYPRFHRSLNPLNWLLLRHLHKWEFLTSIPY